MLNASSLLVVLFALASGASPAPAPQATSSSPTLKPTPPPTDDGLPRPGCVDQSNCWDWARGQCKHAKDSGLLVKTYCIDDYCYVLCPPVLPSVTPTASSNAMKSRFSTATEFHEETMTSPPSSTTSNDFNKTKWKPGMPPPSGKDPVETIPTFTM